jgi:hypothetical protein
VRLGTSATIWHIVAAPVDECEAVGGMTGTANTTCPDPDTNPGRRGEKPVTIFLSCGTAYMKSVDCCSDHADEDVPPPPPSISRPFTARNV